MSGPKYVMVAMSGGVDSSAAAALLREQGHRVIGVTLQLIKEYTGFGCCGSTRDIEDARAVCGKLGIPHFVMNFSATFRENIMDPFVRSYLAGETPNPCIACNRFVKFSALLDKALALGADTVATGHYARILKRNGKFHLARSTYRAKDQSYVLHHLGQKELARLMFPVGELTKEQARDVARRHNLKTAEKPESMEICFVPGADTRGYLRDHTNPLKDRTARAGDIRDTAGRRLGTHMGVAFYTRGQREGLGLALGRPVYVVDLDAETNTVIVGSDKETLSPRFTVRDVSWTLGEPPATAFTAEAQIRSRHTAAPARVQVTSEGAEVEPFEPQRAVTPGQAVVFYRGDEVLGGGTIASVGSPAAS